MNIVALQSVESTLLYLRQSMAYSVDVARAVCIFYENIMNAGKKLKFPFLYILFCLNLYNPLTVFK